MAQDHLFTWLHLSDIHVGGGTPRHRSHQHLVAEELENSLPRILQTLRDTGGPEHLDAIFVTGDLAYSGNSRPDLCDEYQQAGNWLRQVAVALGVDASRVYLVPGNHDVNRSIAESDSAAGALVTELRSGDLHLEDALHRKDTLERLTTRQKGYLDLASKFGPSSGNCHCDGLFWSCRLKPPGVGVYLVGLNTALLSQNNEDRKNLRLANEQLKLLAGASWSDLVILLTHHPLDWLADEKEVRGWVQSKVHIHLSGHIHESTSRSSRIGGARHALVEIAAGAVHSDEKESQTYGFSFASIVRSPDGIAVRVWPFKSSAEHPSFTFDGNGCEVNKDFADHALLPQEKSSRVWRRRVRIAALLAVILALISSGITMLVTQRRTLATQEAVFLSCLDLGDGTSRIPPTRKVIELLERLNTKCNEKLGDSPIAAAQIKNMLADSYHRLGQYGSAASLRQDSLNRLKEVKSARESLVPPELRVHALTGLAEDLLFLQDYAAAEMRAQEAIEHAGRYYQIADPEMTRVRTLKASALLGAGKSEAALHEAEDLVKTMETNGSLSYRQQIAKWEAVATLGWVEFVTDANDTAVTHLQRAVAGLEAMKPRPQAQLALYRRKYALSLRRAEQYGPARKQFDASEAAFRELYGNDHLEVWRTRAASCRLLLREKGAKTAESECRTIIRRIEELEGGGVPTENSMLVHRFLGCILYQKAREEQWNPALWREAEEQIRMTYENDGRFFGKNHRETLDGMWLASFIANEMNDPKEAERLLREALALLAPRAKEEPYLYVKLSATLRDVVRRRDTSSANKMEADLKGWVKEHWKEFPESARRLAELVCDQGKPVTFDPMGR